MAKKTMPLSGLEIPKQRRAISQIMGSLLLLAIVVPIGTTILLSGTSEINAFNNQMKNAAVYDNDGVQEDIIFEHVRFEPNSERVYMTLRNTGSVETTVDRITLINMTNQELLFKIDGVSSFSQFTISLKNNTDFFIDADLGGDAWNTGPNPQNFDYKISIITSRGNFFDTVVRPFNT